MEQSLNEKLLAIKNGDERAFFSLCEDYAALVGSMTQSFFETCHDVDKDDLRQEAVMALYKAAMGFSLDQTEVTFGLYAKICIRNRLISVRRKLTSQSRLKSRQNMQRLRPAGHKDAYEWDVQLSQEVLSLLSPFEQKVFALYVKRCSYSEIARKLSRSEKSIDNAVYRIKRKLRKRIN